MTLTTALLLAGAIVCEVTATIGLRLASAGQKRWYGPVAVGYTVSFVLLALVLIEGLGIGVAYGIWSATGVAVTALAGRVLFGEALTRRMLLGIALIVVGVLLIEMGGGH